MVAGSLPSPIEQACLPRNDREGSEAVVQVRSGETLERQYHSVHGSPKEGRTELVLPQVHASALASIAGQIVLNGGPLNGVDPKWWR